MRLAAGLSGGPLCTSVEVSELRPAGYASRTADWLLRMPGFRICRERTARTVRKRRCRMAMSSTMRRKSTPPPCMLDGCKCGKICTYCPRRIQLDESLPLFLLSSIATLHFTNSRPRSDTSASLDPRVEPSAGAKYLYATRMDVHVVN